MGLLGTSPVMIGREAEVRALRDVFESGARGEPRVALVSGEAGIGKSRLIAEFLEEITGETRMPPVTIAIGQCVDLGDIGAPFIPLRRMLRDLYFAVGEAEFRSAAGTSLVVNTLATLVPELAADGELAAGLAPDFITEAIERLITNLSETRHLVLVFEDLQWADSATLALLKALSITLRAAHVTALMTYRSDDVGRGHPLRPLLADLDRSRAVIPVPLSRLAPAEAVLVARAVHDSLRDDEAAAIAARSEGVPFFIEELVDLEADTPPLGTLRDVVLARFERLTPGAGRVVGAVSAGGVRVDDRLIGEVFDGDVSELRAGLREAIDANILVADGDGYRFRHALIQEAVHDDLLPSERAELHARYAVVLESRVAAGQMEQAAELAEHWLKARDVSKAFDATLAARRYAAETLAPITAAKLGERLLELWAQVPDAAARARSSRAALSLAVADEYDNVDERPRALRVAEAGLGFTTPDERLLRARLLVEVGNCHRYLTGWPSSLQSYHAARALLDEDGGAGDLALLARVDAALAYGDENLRPMGLEILERAVDFAERSGDETALATALERRAYWVGTIGDWPRAVADMRRAARLSGEEFAHHLTMTNLLDMLSKVGEYDEGIEIGLRAYAETLSNGRERGHGGYLLGNVSEMEGLRGDIDAALVHGDRALSLMPPSFFTRYLLTDQATTALWGDRADLQRGYRSQMDAIEQDPLDIADVVKTCLLDGATAFAATGRGVRPRGSRELADRVAGILRFRDPALPDLEMQGETEPVLPLAGWLAATDPEARSILLPAIEHAIELPDAGPHSRALKSLVRAYLDGGVDAWREALAEAEEGRIPNRYVHLARLELADALLRADERDAASAMIDRIITEAPIHGASLVARWARELGARAGLRIAVAPPPPAQTPAALTPRELQVLALVAEGLTNAQIGQRLFISPKTASVHVSAILVKIGAANRTEAAGWYASAQNGQTTGTHSTATTR